jgi:hypothetical protein
MGKVASALVVAVCWASAANCATPCHLSDGAQLRVAEVEADLLRTNGAETGAIYRLVTDRSSTGDEALAVLIGYYLGESTEPECEALARGKRMVRHLEHFDKCQPPVKLKPSPAHSRAETVSLIKQGKTCQ